MNLSRSSLLRVTACAVALFAVSAMSTPAGAAPPDDAKPAQRGQAHRGHHRHLSPRQKARLRHFLRTHPNVLKNLRHHAAGKGHGHHGQNRGHAAPAKPSVN